MSEKTSLRPLEVVNTKHAFRRGSHGLENAKLTSPHQKVFSQKGKHVVVVHATLPFLSLEQFIRQCCIDVSFV